MSESNVLTPVVSFTDEQVNAALTKIKHAGRSMARGIEAMLVMSVYDSIVNESAVVANALIDVLRASTKKDGIVAFLEHHGKLFNRGGKTGFTFFNLGAQEKLSWTKDYVEQVQEAAEDWEAFKPAVKVQDDLDIVAALQAVLKKHDAAVKAGKTVVNAALAAYISPLVAQYTARVALEAAAATAPVVASASTDDAKELAALVLLAEAGIEVVAA